MKIVYVTDIHDALKDLRRLLSKTEADLYLLSGDIIYKAFYEEEKIYNFVCLQEELYQIGAHFGQDLYPMDLAIEILRFPDKYTSIHWDTTELEKKADTYRQLFEAATKTMKGKYSLVEELIQKHSHATTWILPGNYDLDLRYTDLHERNLHRKIKHKRALKFAGYGGAPVKTSGIPEKLAIVYHEKQENGRLYSEPLDFFNRVEPNILMLHNPAYGYFDRIPGLGHVGSQGIRTYLDEHKPLLVLSGHIHEDYGIAQRKGTIFLNPSNFGGVDSAQGWQNGGFYSEIIIKDKQIQTVSFMRIGTKTAVPLMNISITDEGLVSQGKVSRLPARHKNTLELNQLIRDANGNVIC